MMKKYQIGVEIMDLLALIHSGSMSLREAEDLFDENIAKIHRRESPPEWSKTFELSLHEATAYLHGANLADLVKVRYEGWPTICSRCGRTIDYKKFGWWFVHSDDGVPRLRHIVCPTSKTRQRKRLTPKKPKRTSREKRAKRHGKLLK